MLACFQFRRADPQPGLPFVLLTGSLLAGSLLAGCGRPSGDATDLISAVPEQPAEVTVELSSDTNQRTQLTSIPITVTFSEPVNGFALTDLSLVNASASGLSGSGASYSFSLTPLAQGELSVAVQGQAAQSSSGVANVASTVLSRIFDNVVPTVSISSTASDPTPSASIPV
jgi:hypothetical protein